MINESLQSLQSPHTLCVSRHRLKGNFVCSNISKLEFAIGRGLGEANVLARLHEWLCDSKL